MPALHRRDIVSGIKRHLAVDTLGFPFFTHCTKANVSDNTGLIEMLTKNIERTLANATAKVNLCFIRLMVKRLAAPS